MSLNGLSIVSARPALQACESLWWCTMVQSQSGITLLINVAELCYIYFHLHHIQANFSKVSENNCELVVQSENDPFHHHVSPSKLILKNARKWTLFNNNKQYNKLECIHASSPSIWMVTHVGFVSQIKLSKLSIFVKLVFGNERVKNSRGGWYMQLKYPVITS